MTTAITLARLRDLRLGGMAQALERQLEQGGTYDALPFLERLALLVEQECLEREQLWTLTEARVVIEDWRWKYNHIRPHRSLGYITPIQFAQKETETRDAQGSGSGRPTASLRPNLDFLYNLKNIIRDYQTNTLCGPVWVT